MTPDPRRDRAIEVVAEALRAQEPWSWPAVVVDRLIAEGLLNTWCNHGQLRGQPLVAAVPDGGGTGAP